MSSPTARTSSRAPSPPATRAARPTWRDPRLVVGLLLVCTSAVVGARVLAGADDTVPVLVARAPLAAGETLGQDDLATVRVRFADGDDADRYLPADAVTEGSSLLRPVGAGELVPRAALGPAGSSGQVAVPLAVDSARVPAAVRAGAVVDVWAGPDPETAGPAARTARLLRKAPVLSVVRQEGFGPGTVVQVVVGVPGDEADQVAEAVAGLSDRALLVVARQG